MRLQPSEVRAIRLKLRKTQEEMARALGVHVRTYRRWEIEEAGASPMGSRLLRRMVEDV